MQVLRHLEHHLLLAGHRRMQEVVHFKPIQIIHLEGQLVLVHSAQITVIRRVLLETQFHQVLLEILHRSHQVLLEAPYNRQVRLVIPNNHLVHSEIQHNLQVLLELQYNHHPSLEIVRRHQALLGM